jgi:plasmid maintenance system antidote protein VapI
MNIEFKIGIIRHFRSQTRAAKPLGTDEPRLSRLIHGHCEPTAEERRRFAAVLGLTTSRRTTTQRELRIVLDKTKSPRRGPCALRI